MKERIQCARERTEKPDLAARKMHSHETYEIFYFVSGDVDYLVEGSTYRLYPGDLMLMRKGEVHIPRIRSAVPFERMHVNFSPEGLLREEDGEYLLSSFLSRPQGKGNRFRADWDQKGIWRHLVEGICTAETETGRLCYLLPLLKELSDLKEEALSSGEEKEEAGPMGAILHYVNENLASPLSLEEISRTFFISQNHLNRLFRDSTGTTFWHYVTVKRLFLAKEKLAKGEKPTKVFSECGFRDYTTFFRAYKKEFGTSPTKKDA